MSFKIKDLIKISIFPFLIFMIGYSLEIGSAAYHILWWPNRLVHFLGGLSMAVAGYFILDLTKKWKLSNTSNKVLDFLIIFLFVMSTTVFWEFYEFLSDKYFFTNAQPSVDDTMKDQFMGMLGAVFLGFVWYIASLIGKIRK